MPKYTATTRDASGKIHKGTAYTFTIAMRIASYFAGTLMAYRYHPQSEPTWDVDRMPIAEACRVYRTYTSAKDGYPIYDEETANDLIHGDILVDDEGYEYTVCDPITDGGVNVHRS